MNNYIIYRDDELKHFGIKGMHWGVRRYQNEDGSLTTAGKIRYRLESATGTYDPKGNNPYVSERRKQNRLKEMSDQSQKKTNGSKEGHTIKNRVKSILGLYEEDDNNPYVSDKRREDRRRQKEEQKKARAAEENKKAQNDIKKGDWYKTYNDAVDSFNPFLEKLNEKLGDKADINNPDYIEAVGNLWNSKYSETIIRKYGAGVDLETIESFPMYNMYLAEIKNK